MFIVESLQTIADCDFNVEVGFRKQNERNLETNNNDKKKKKNNNNNNNNINNYIIKANKWRKCWNTKSATVCKLPCAGASRWDPALRLLYYIKVYHSMLSYAIVNCTLYCSNLIVESLQDTELYFNVEDYKDCWNKSPHSSASSLAREPRDEIPPRATAGSMYIVDRCLYVFETLEYVFYASQI